MTANDFAELVDVSRETLRQLEDYLELMERWQRAINLVGPKTLADPWRRHILDSAQLFLHLPKKTGAVYDLGSGAGLPGLVLAIMGRDDLHLVESDRRKGQFLKEVVRSLDLHVHVHVQRIETLPARCADVIIARALAPLPRLLDLVFPLLRPASVCYFPKGRSASDELTDARKCWRMSADSFPSLSDPSASVLKLRDIIRAPLHRQ
jgi:16S rRNA (guanine527-N7)-methyltransferase